MTNINEEMQNVNVTISVPVKDIAGLVAIDYEELTSKVYDNLDMNSIASDIVDEMDSSDLIEKIDMYDLARSFKDSIDISDYIDTNEIASNAVDMIDFADQIKDLLISYDPLNACDLGDFASKAMINAIRYDIISHLYGQDKSKLDVTITDVLRKFIRQEMNMKQELNKVQQNQHNFTLAEIYQVLIKTPDMSSNLLTYLVDEFNKIGNAKLSEDIVIKAD